MKRLFITAMGLCACAAQAQLIVANDQSGVGNIYNVNVNTGVATVLHSSSGTDGKAWGMAADEGNGILYWNNGGTLFSASYASLLSGSPVINSVSLTFNGGATNFVGLGYNPATGKLLGTRNITTEAVYEIDPLSGVATILFTYPTTFDFGGVDFDDTTGHLYGLSDTPSTARGLYRIENGSQTLLAPYPGGETDIDGLAVGDGKAFYVTDGPNTTQANFYVYDIASGTQIGTLPSPFTGSGTFSAAAYAPGLVPEPATMITLAAGLGLLARRRRKN